MFTLLQSPTDLDAVSMVMDIQNGAPLKLLVDSGSAISLLEE